MDEASKPPFYLGRYNCIERLGAGPLGETFRGKIYGVAGFEKQFAVKKVAPALCADEAFVERFVKASSAYSNLDDERIARVHEVNAQGTQYYLVVDVVRGIDLGKLFETLRMRGEALGTDIVLLIAGEVATGVSHAHGRRDLLPEGVLHLGLTPPTVMATPEGDVRLLDVGLLTSLFRSGWASDDALAPTLGYLAPEVLRREAADARADVFSLGALLHEALAGARPFPGASAAEVRARLEGGPPPPPATDARLQAIVTRALQPDRAERFASMEEMGAALASILEGRAIKARNDLAALVRRLVGRPMSRTGSFAAVAVPTMEMTPPPAPAPAQATARPWAPPAAAKPPPPIGAKLDPTRPRNTSVGMGPDDSKVTLGRLDLPGPATVRSMDIIAEPADPSEELTRPMDMLQASTLAAACADPDTMPMTKLEADELAALSGAGSSEPIVIEPADEPAPLPALIGPPPIPEEVGGPGRSGSSAATVMADSAPRPASMPTLMAETAPTSEPTWALPAAVEARVDPPLLMPTSGPGSTSRLPALGQPLAPPPRRRGLLAVGGLVVVAGVALLMLRPWAEEPSAAPSPPVAAPSPPVAAPSPPVAAPAPPVAAPSPPVAAPSPPVAAPSPPVAAPSPPVAAPSPPVAAPSPPVAAPSPPVAAAPTESAKPHPAAPAATAAVSAGGAAHVTIATTPAGAALFVDGQPRGTSPAQLDLPPGPHQLVVAADGFRLHKGPIKIAGPTELSLPLEPAKLPAEIAGHSGLKVRCKTLGELRIFVDGADSGRQCPNEERIPVAPGAHKIGLYSPRTDETHEVDADIEDDADHSKRVRTKF